MTDQSTAPAGSPGRSAKGIGALLLGLGVGLIGFALAGPRKEEGGAEAPAPDELAVQPPAAPGEPVAANDGPSGPTAPARPAPTGEEGHPAPDLASTEPLGAGHRAPPAFRPDMDAPMTPAEREALRPATGPSPSLVSDQGSGGIQGPGGDRL